MQIDLHLHCDEWNQAFSSGQWEPEVIVRKLPEFLQFVKEVQRFLVREMQSDGPLKGKILYIFIIQVNSALEHSI